MESGHYRAATDKGLLKDKVCASDPAAAPLHTDSEASDQPTSAEASLQSLRHQQSIAEGLPNDGHTRLGWELAAVTASLVALGVAAGVLGLSGL